MLLRNFPLPPSLNHLYPTVMRGKRPVRVKSREYLEFGRAVHIWALRNREALVLGRAEAARAPAQGLLAVHFSFHIQTEKLYCKDGRPKRLDVSNRVKPCEDALSDLLQIDDRYFWRVSCEKIPAREDGVDIMISVYKPGWCAPLAKP